MMCFLFTRCRNRLDVVTVAVGFSAVTSGHWVSGIVICLIGAAISAYGEMRLAEKTAQAAGGAR